MESGILNELQQRLARINDVPVHLRVSDFHLAEREHCSALLGRPLADVEDEQLLIREDESGAALSLYVDTAVLERLKHHNPVRGLNDANLADYCTAMEGVSHFQYLVWCIRHHRQLSLLELELQGEVDKYAVAVCLLREQGCRDLPSGLLARLFERVAFVSGLSADSLQRYTEANRLAARFCQLLERRFLGARRFRPEAWLRALREFYRRPHHQKMRYALQ
jgi:hypothetical protein